MFVLSVDVCVDMFVLCSHLSTITATSLMSQVVNNIIFVVIVSLFVIFISTSRIPIFPGIMSIEKPQIK